MQAQKIITEGDKDYLVIAIPGDRELLGYAHISRTGNSIVARHWARDKSTMYAGRSFKIDRNLITGRRLNQTNKHFHKADMEVHEFNGIGLPCLKISVSKSFIQKR